MTARPRLLVFAGPNGSGKSTISGSGEKAGVYINADEIKRVRGCSDLEAAREAEELRESALAAGSDFTFETVLSTDRNLLLLDRAKAAGYRLTAVFVLTVDPWLNVFRVRSRVLGGGHDVPSDRTVARYWRSLANLPRLVALCDAFCLIDNTDQPVVLITKDVDGIAVYPSVLWGRAAILDLIGGGGEA